MKKIGLLAVIFALSSALTGCASIYYPSNTHEDLLKETWAQKINLDPSKWTQNTDTSYMNGKPDLIERELMHAPVDNALSKMNVRVGDFDSILLNGRFVVQITGGENHNKVVLLGPNALLRQISVEIHGNVLCVTQVCDKNGCGISPVIVRIGINQLHLLNNLGCTRVIGNNIISDHLIIRSSGGGDILLDGYDRLNLIKVSQAGDGVSLF